MRPDIVNLRQFYSSRLGRKVKRRLRRVLRDHWPAEPGLVSVGLGYTTHLLPLPKADANARVLALMPVPQGAIYWPVDSANHSVLADEMRPPLMPNSVHRLLITHGFEHTPVPDELLKIWWQLLAPGGRLLLIVPNRRGLWAHFGATPFTSGTAHTLSGLRALLNAANFTIRDVRSALYTPPSTHPFWLNAFNMLEWLGCSIFPRIGGVFVIEAEKQIYAGVQTPAPASTLSQWVSAPAMQGASPSISPSSHKAG